MSAGIHRWGRKILASTWLRHLLAGTVTAVLVVLFLLWRGAGFSGGRWNTALAWAAVVLLAVTLSAGPLARIWSPVRRMLPLRREMGSWSALAALGHVLFVFQEWAHWSLSALWLRFDGQQFALDGGLALANALGILAAGYALVLLVTSNDASQRRLGKRWSWLQRGATTFLLLSAFHTAYFLYLGRTQFHPDRLPWGNHALGGLSLLFLLLLAMVVTLRTVAFWKGRSR